MLHLRCCLQLLSSLRKRKSSISFNIGRIKNSNSYLIFISISVRLYILVYNFSDDQVLVNISENHRNNFGFSEIFYPKFLLLKRRKWEFIATIEGSCTLCFISSRTGRKPLCAQVLKNKTTKSSLLHHVYLGWSFGKSRNTRYIQFHLCIDLARHLRQYSLLNHCSLSMLKWRNDRMSPNPKQSVIKEEYQNGGPVVIKKG